MINNSVITIAAIIFFIMTGCAKEPYKPASYEDGAVVAVWDLENLSVTENPNADLGEFLSATIIETIGGKSGFEVVERERLLLALEELSLGSSELADESTQLEIGKLVGAKLMVFGAYQVIGELMRLDLRLVEVETGAVLKAAERTISAAQMSQWIDAAKDATLELF